MTATLTPLARVALAASLGLCLAPAAHADAWKVTPDGSGDFTEISDAVAWATEGDVIYALEGAYGPVLVQAKGLSIVADELADVVVEQLVVRDLGPDQHFALSGIQATRAGTVDQAEAGLRFESCRGSIRLQGCDVRGSSTLQASHRGSGASFVDCDDVALKDCDLNGGPGTYAGPGNPGRFGLQAVRSKVSAFDCTVRGPGWSGIGLECIDARLLLSNCFVRGGPGRQDDSCFYSGGPGGTGIVAAGASTLRLQGTRPLGGSPGVSEGFFGCFDKGPPGVAFELDPSVVLTQVGRVERSWRCDFVEQPGGPFRISYEGQPGDRFSVLRSALPAHDVQHPELGAWLLVPDGDRAFLGVADEDGQLSVVQTPAAALFTDPDAGFFLQGVVEAADGSTHLLSHGHVAMVPTGTAEACDRIVHVRTDGTPGASGTTWADAVPSLNEAIAIARTANSHCGAGSEIWVAGGTYTADPGQSSFLPAFRVDFPVVLRGGFSGNEASPDERPAGAPPTVLSGDLLGDDQPGFQNYEENSFGLLGLDIGFDQDHGAVVLDRMTFRAAYQGYALYVQGAERVLATELTIERIRGGNTGRVVHLYNIDGSRPLLEVSLRRCRFLDNLGFGGAPGCQIEAQRTRVTQCEWVGNAGTFDDDNDSLLYVRSQDSEGIARIEGCLFRRNSLEDGHVMRVFSTDARVTGCTFTGNRSTTGTAGVYLIDSRTRVENSVLWGNRSLAHPGSNLDAYLAVFDSPYSDAGFTLESSCIEGLNGSWPSANCFALDPQLDAQSRPGPGSPCLDAGNNALVPPDALDLDGDGDVLEPTPVDLAGAPRFVDDPAAPDVGQGTAPLVDVGAFERQP